MRLRTGAHAHLVMLIALAAPAGAAAAATPAFVNGSATYRERVVLPPDAVFEATLEEIARADAPAIVLGRVAWRAPGEVPIRFQIPYAPLEVQGNRRYVVRARITAGDRLLFTTDTAYPVFGPGAGTRADVVLRRVAEPAPVAGGGSRALLGPLPGTFTGTLPCADCAGIEHRLLLRDDGTYALRRRYLDRGPAGVFYETGVWAMGADDSTLVVYREGGRAIRFTIRDATAIRMLDHEGRPIASDLPYDLVRTREVADAPLEDTYWQLVQLRDEAVRMGRNQRPPHVLFEPKEHRVRGAGGCNSLSGPYRIDGASLRLGPLVSTKMACPDMDVEKRFLPLLDHVRGWRVRGESLELLDGSGQTLARLERYLE